MGFGYQFFSIRALKFFFFFTVKLNKKPTKISEQPGSVPGSLKKKGKRTVAGLNKSKVSVNL